MRYRKPDLMFILSVLAGAGVLLTTAFQARAEGQPAIIESPGELVARYVPSSGASTPSLRNAPQPVLFGRGSDVDFDGYGVAVRLGVTMDGDLYDMTMGEARVSTPLVYSGRPARYAVVGVELKW